MTRLPICLPCEKRQLEQFSTPVRRRKTSRRRGNRHKSRRNETGHDRNDRQFKRRVQQSINYAANAQSRAAAGGAALDTVQQARQTIFDILDRKDHRLFVVVGPCSIHDPQAAIDYAHRLKELAPKLADTLFLVMRVYFEKPRTSIGWKGLINDPHLDDSFQIEEGLRIGRKLLLDIADLGLPTSTEALDPISPQYLQDLIAWSAIGARTTESQTHREMSSGLSLRWVSRMAQTVVLWWRSMRCSPFPVPIVFWALTVTVRYRW